jgi:hypothetical protein
MVEPQANELELLKLRTDTHANKPLDMQANEKKVTLTARASASINDRSRF